MESKQVGFSPKLIGAVLAILVAVAFLIFHLADKDFAIGLLVAGFGVLGIGAAAGPGEVEQNVTDFIEGGGKPDA